MGLSEFLEDSGIFFNDAHLADAVEELSDDEAVSLISALSTARAADVLDAMGPNNEIGRAHV